MKSKRNHEGKIISTFFNPASKSVLPNIEAIIGKRPLVARQKPAPLIVDLTLSDDENVDEGFNPSEPVIMENQPSSDEIVKTSRDVVAPHLELPSQPPSLSLQAIPNTDLVVAANAKIDSPLKESIVDAASSSTSALSQAPVKQVSPNLSKFIELQIQLNADLIRRSPKHSNPSEQCESIEVDYEEDEITNTDSKQTANSSSTTLSANKAITDKPTSTIRSAVRFKKARLLEALNSFDDAQTLQYISNLDNTITQFIHNRLERIELLVGLDDSSPLKTAKGRSSKIVDSLVKLLKKHLEADDFQQALQSNQHVCGTESEQAKAIDIDTQPKTAQVSQISFYSNNQPSHKPQQKSDSMVNEHSNLQSTSDSQGFTARK